MTLDGTKSNKCFCDPKTLAREMISESESATERLASAYWPFFVATNAASGCSSAMSSHSGSRLHHRTDSLGW